MILDTAHRNIKDSKSIVSFETEGGGSHEAWDRYISVEGKKAFHIGNICDTCSFFFERVNGANRSISIKKVIETLNSGIQKFDKKFLDQIQEIIPDGEYIVLLSEVTPQFVLPTEENDYFCHEERELWDEIALFEAPHDPKTEYYRLPTKVLLDKEGVFEFLIPMFPSSQLNSQRVEEYSSLFSKEQKPTAVALSVLDVKQPADWEGDKNIEIHFCLAHYLLDGHHKVYAAAKNSKPITLISFLAVNKGVSTKEDIEKLIKEMKC